MDSSICLDAFREMSVNEMYAIDGGFEFPGWLTAICVGVCTLAIAFAAPVGIGMVVVGGCTVTAGASTGTAMALGGAAIIGKVTGAY